VVPGFAVPESCLWDPGTKSWYVSNIAPQSMDLTAPDGIGWISRLDASGAIVDEKWAEGFDTPAGLRIAGDVLIVNDIKRIHEVELASGTILLTHEFPNAVLLNDPAVDLVAGIGYATDTFGNAIYQFQLGDLSNDALLVADAGLKGPNGLHYADGALYVASLVDFVPENLGPFLRLDVASKELSQLGDFLGKFDGLEPWKGGFMLTENPSGVLLLVDQEGNESVFIDLLTDHGFAPAADHGIDEAGGVICVPDLASNVGFVRLK